MKEIQIKDQGPFNQSYEGMAYSSRNVSYQSPIVKSKKHHTNYFSNYRTLFLEDDTQC